MILQNRISYREGEKNRRKEQRALKRNAIAKRSTSKVEFLIIRELFSSDLWEHFILRNISHNSFPFHMQISVIRLVSASNPLHSSSIPLLCKLGY